MDYRNERGALRGRVENLAKGERFNPPSGGQ
jgi:hypothetical protein